VVPSAMRQGLDSTPPGQALRLCGSTRGADDRLKRSPNQPGQTRRLNGLLACLKVRPAEPYLVLDAGEFTACCRSCRWHSVPCGGLVEVRLAFNMHTCSSSPVADHVEAAD
jgi:hypothetical protein